MTATLPVCPLPVPQDAVARLASTVGTAHLDSQRTTDRTPQTGPQNGTAGDAEFDGDGVRETCPRPVRIVAEAMNTGTGDLRDLAAGEVWLDCDQWTCPVCGPKMRRRWTAHLTAAFAPMAGLHFVTLTLDPKCGIGPEESHAYLKTTWAKYRKRLNNRSSSPVSFAATVERQKSGMAHLHCVMSCPGVDADTLAAQWFAAGGGVAVDVQALDGDRDEIARRVGYTVKYALKGAADGHVRSRRYVWTSNDGIGYNSAASKAVRTSYVNSMLDQDETPTGETHGAATPQGETPADRPARLARPEDELRDGEVLVWTTDAVRGGGTADPDKPTAEQLARWAALDLDKRSTSFKMKGADGVWTETTQHADGTRTTRKLTNYLSLYDRRVLASEGLDQG